MTMKENRSAELVRKTNETEISVALALDGTGTGDIQTGIPFFDHMLVLLAAHAKIDLGVRAKGDLPHHLIEDVAIVFGTVLAEALGNKAGVRRVGSCDYPMDESLARVALDLSGRSWLTWDVSFRFEQVEGMPTEMFYHFFKSLCDNAKCCLNVEVKGENEHHKIEAVFKAFARALREAAEPDPRGSGIPSTKGIL